VGLRDDAARLLRRGERHAAAADVIALLERAGLALLPLHPATEDPELQSWFRLDVADGATAAELADRLLELPAVTAAYVKPVDSAP